ncbi:SPOR domain-containing protein [Pleionea sediminis]|uniref:SPOR domain-containing protein n=1 Tax=Pleionea sediminis TaxID=2569479 RepID=UPI001186D49E|nr:SPOR domain-containing protein [Pleionea sediminis]
MDRSKSPNADPAINNLELASPAKETADGLLLSRKELYGLFFTLLSLPIVSFSAGIYLQRSHSDLAIQTAETATTNFQSKTTQPLSRNEESILDTQPLHRQNRAEAIASAKKENDETTTKSPQNQSLMRFDEGEIAIHQHQKKQETFASNSPESPKSVAANITTYSSSPRESEPKQLKTATIYSSKPVREQYIVQVALFNNQSNALKWRQQQNQDFQYWILPRAFPDGTIRYSVILGLFSEKENAESTKVAYRVNTGQRAYITKLDTQHLEVTLANL